MAKEAPEATRSTWRELAVARSLDPARARAEQRVQRFLDAALELMTASEDNEFTVQEVVERSGQSLRSFYQYFAGKYELLLALFEEQIRTAATFLAEKVDEERDPVARLHRFALEYYRMSHPNVKAKGSKAGPTPLYHFAQQLLTDHPKEASVAFGPLVGLLEALLDDAAAAGGIRKGLDHHRVAGVLMQAISFHAFAATISGTSVRTDVDAAAQDLWDLLLNGLSK
ncbi:MAG TPA: TetR/AcrR family transcriptional regulator [Acidimicrobiales bacterium]|nr:TetR/AcrR family transcriptional regulator [Acidimicrobiales bacterium]